MRLGGVVVARDHGAAPAGQGHGRGLVARPEPGLEALQMRGVGSIRLRPHALAVAQVALEGGGVAELALAGGVVHQADDPHAVLRPVERELVLQRLRADLGAQVEVVVEPERARRAHRPDLGDERAAILAEPRRGVGGDRAHAHRVEHGGDPAARQLRVVRGDGGANGPAHARPRLQVALEVVGVQLDQAGREQVALAVHRAARDVSPLVHLGDDATAQHDAPAHRLARKHQHGAREDGLLGWVEVTERGGAARGHGVGPRGAGPRGGRAAKGPA